MGLFSFLSRKKVEPVQEERKVVLQGLGFATSSSYSNEHALRLSAVYAAVNQISNSIAILPINVYEKVDNNKKQIKHQLSELLNGRPDMKNSHFNFVKQLLESVMLRGNGYALIVRDERLNVKQLVYLDTADVQPMPQKDGSIKYLVNGLKNAVDAVDMIDLHMHVDEMYHGISVLRYAWQCLKTASEAEKQAGNFFAGGNNLSGVIKVNAPLTTEQKKELIDNWKGTFNNSSNGYIPVAVLPQHVDFQPISVSPEDAQLLDSREFSILEIARFFLIPPSKLFVFDNVSYNSLEYSQLMYLQDTLLPYVQMIEDEINTKCFRPSEQGKRVIDFDFTALMNADKKTEAEYYRTLITNGIATVNEARGKLGFGPAEVEGADELYMQLSYATVKDISEGKYVKQNAQDQTSNVKNDNKVIKTDDE